MKLFLEVPRGTVRNFSCHILCNYKCQSSHHKRNNHGPGKGKIQVKVFQSLINHGVGKDHKYNKHHIREQIFGINQWGSFAENGFINKLK